MSVKVKEVVEVEHMAGCRRNKGCGPTCKRIKQKGEWEAHVIVHPPGKKPVRRRQRIPSEYARTATERWGWAETQEQLLKEVSRSTGASVTPSSSSPVSVLVRSRRFACATTTPAWNRWGASRHPGRTTRAARR
jgi:hypothetical protein